MQMTCVYVVVVIVVVVAVSVHCSVGGAGSKHFVFGFGLKWFQFSHFFACFCSRSIFSVHRVPMLFYFLSVCSIALKVLSGIR